MLLGLVISIPIVILGSSLFIKFVDRFPVIIYIGGGVIAWTSAKMIMHEPFLKVYFLNNSFLYWGDCNFNGGKCVISWKDKKFSNKKRKCH